MQEKSLAALNFQTDSSEVREPGTPLTRRKLLIASMALGTVSALFRNDATAAGKLDAFEDALNKLINAPELVDEARGQDEIADSLEAGLERAPIRSPKSSTAISANATNLIVASEVSNKKQYEARYTRPTWPKGKSGATIGIGYDIGYVTADELSQDWAPYISSSVIAELSQACGVTGTAAGGFTKQMQDAVVDWKTASNQFTNEAQPRYVGATEKALHNTNELSPDCLGALVSLVYNRGATFAVPPEKDKTERYREMRAIWKLMDTRQYSGIPEQIRLMKRIWKDDPNMRGLLLRRDAEAALFEYGLQKH